MRAIDDAGEILLTRAFGASVRGFQLVRDAFGNVVGSVTIDPAISRLSGARVRGGAGIEQIRRMTHVALVDVWPPVRRWWEVRRSRTITMGPLRLWWDNYAADGEAVSDLAGGGR